jgi:lysophospholipase L1-like esterase
VNNNLYGSAIRLKYSNIYNLKAVHVKGVQLCVLGIDGTEVKRRKVSESFQIRFGENVYSDPTEVDMISGMRLQVEMEFATCENPLSGNTFEGYVAMILQSIEIRTEEKVSVLACFGDSLTHQGVWTKPFFERLYVDFPGKIAAFEVGINGNRLLCDSPEYENTLGLSGLKRFNHDILDLVGLTHVICALGINDIGLPDTEKTPFSEFPKFEEMISAYSDIAARLRKRGVKAVVVTITPRNWQGNYIKEREELRLKINEWLLNTNLFDEVFDFSSPLTKEGKSGLKSMYDSGDGIHINAEGGKKLQAAIRVNAFFSEIAGKR